MDEYKLRQLLKKEEGPKLDFKAELNLSTEGDKKELTKDVIAMANSRGGRGYILFGIEDKTKRIIGINPADFSEEQIQQIIYNRCDPPIPISVDFFNIEGKTVGALTVYRSSNKPHQMIQNGAFYVRRGSTTGVARRSEIANLLQENGLMTYETVILKNVGLEELDYDLIKDYLGTLNVYSDNPSELILEALGIIGEMEEGAGYHPTIGGMLLFGKNPYLFLPHVYIKVDYKNDVRLFYGNILKMLDDVSAYMRSIIKIENYPFNALEEVIANALVHRDYLDVSKGITITVTQKNIEISNPGALIANNSVYRFSRESNPDRRNSWLYQRLLTLDTKRRFMKSGLGMKRVKNSFASIGPVKFINIGSQNLFKVLLPFM
ncbi:MAG TPA: putative DNA binding domain-containing protein [Acetivibrio sp.]|jgi:ATP-dependent DNA helicase RecG|nr:transcriptional regulator [Clostridium sp.]HOQ36531.1 putative DNA binding domain-containing protein [Acetivibrio sp.]HPT91201.1 putative DNA binding domain-containing protein [Acetivibrio sp.]HQA56893.1 putative DNA binding domain-containing protein [Acetivibrio sp.]